jgi:alkanesulfonate monooxygenase SsuD/methylene tetrahydromethanopterin reductase-like flavin-dependent oxidoreductase (luciferase family)
MSGQHPAGDSAMGAVGQHLEQVELARELGFSSVWTSQHFLSHPFLYLQSVPLLARVAAAAEGMTVGTAILLLTLLNPVEVAENAATLDAIAAGRFVLGVGIGYRPVENAAFGVAQNRADLFERKLEIVRRLLAGDRVTATRPGFELEDARRADRRRSLRARIATNLRGHPRRPHRPTPSRPPRLQAAMARHAPTRGPELDAAAGPRGAPGRARAARARRQRLTLA